MSLDTRQMRLPGFEGHDPIGTDASFSGSVDRRTGPLHYGEQVYFIVEAEVVGVEHATSKNGMVRKHRLKLADAYQLDEQVGSDMCADLADQHREMTDGLTGQVSLTAVPDGKATAADEADEAEADAE